jgi:hypothetical protein
VGRVADMQPEGWPSMTDENKRSDSQVISERRRRRLQEIDDLLATKQDREAYNTRGRQRADATY